MKTTEKESPAKEDEIKPKWKHNLAKVEEAEPKRRQHLALERQH